MVPIRFQPSPKAPSVELDLYGTVYQFDVSPTSQVYIKQCVALQAEGQKILAVDMIAATTMEEVDALFDRLSAKQKELIDILLPGKWDELWKACGSDVLSMTELILFIVTELRNGAGRAMVAQALPRRPAGEQI